MMTSNIPNDWFPNDWLKVWKEHADEKYGTSIEYKKLFELMKEEKAKKEKPESLLRNALDEKKALENQLLALEAKISLLMIDQAQKIESETGIDSIIQEEVKRLTVA